MGGSGFMGGQTAGGQVGGKGGLQPQPQMQMPSQAPAMDAMYQRGYGMANQMGAPVPMQQPVPMQPQVQQPPTLAQQMQQPQMQRRTQQYSNNCGHMPSGGFF